MLKCKGEAAIYGVEGPRLPAHGLDPRDRKRQEKLDGAHARGKPFHLHVQ